MARSIRTWLRLAVLAAVAAFMAVPSMQAAAGVDLPKLDLGKIASTGDKCVEDTQFMRRNHMDLLKHHRDDTMRKGIRTTRHSLKKCVECHASEKTGSVAASKEDFCAACHSYASVKLDCWDCHATKPAKKPAPQAGLPAASPLMATTKNGASGDSQ
ncbi:MAG: hypothetical protein H6935_16245 [Thiobacillus sp.]|nr:hypothetical protein [Thiobacillus sp.]